eukprot:TRINITY_DN15785_c0_g2_i1.p1 TRINITY_DN15785_c0_g2~~TRINITY_DN15785_c0_g2_i1.p1  ORF type:complete len:664 (+),score=151.09 TRINITY_DN15785_c0_g2_i1:48-2039(+)
MKSQRGSNLAIAVLILILAGWSLSQQFNRPSHVVLNVSRHTLEPTGANTTSTSLQLRVDTLEAKLADMSKSLISLQVARLHDKYTASEQTRIRKQEEENQLLRQITTANLEGRWGATVKLNRTLMFVHAERVAQTMIKERLLDDMRELLYPGYRQEPDNSTTYVSQDLPDDFDPTVPLLKEIRGTQMNGNAYGVWAWKKDAIHLGKQLIVIAAEKPRRQTLTLLLNQGFVVWKRRFHCPGDCREGISYLAYLADDTSPAKPMPPTVTFIHGHMMSWHQQDSLMDTIQDGIDCSSKTKSYVPLGHHGMPNSNKVWGRESRFVLAYIEAMGEFGIPKGMNFTNFCCAQFVVTRDLIQRNSRTYYKTFFEKKVELRINSFMTEYAFGWMFGDPEVRNATRGPPDVCAKKHAIVAPFVNTSRSGQWTNPAVRPRVTFVLGERDRSDAVSNAVVHSLMKFAPADTSVWMRHKCFWCGAQWRGQHCCGFTKGYLSFINTFKNDAIRPESDFYVFLKGSEPFTQQQVDGIMRKVDCAEKTQRYTPLHTEWHLKTNKELGYHWLTNLTERSYATNEPLRAFNGSEFVVPHNVLVNAGFDALQSTFELFTIECGVRRTKPQLLDHYWHWLMGEKPRMVNCPAGAPICATCDANPDVAQLPVKRRISAKQTAN